MKIALKNTIVMVGMMGAGKTAIGRSLAQKLGVPFLDCDEEIVTAANMEIPEIFSKFGETFFRDKESRVLGRLLERAPCIVSTGGGAFIQPQNRDLIAHSATSVWLKADIDLLWSRVQGRSTRPLLNEPEPRVKLETLYAGRENYYAMADVTVQSTAEDSIETMTQRVFDVLVENGTLALRQAKG